MITKEQVDEWHRQVMHNVALSNELARQFRSFRRTHRPSANARHLVSRNKREGWYQSKHGGSHFRAGKDLGKLYSLRHWMRFDPATAPHSRVWMDEYEF